MSQLLLQLVVELIQKILIKFPTVITATLVYLHLCCKGKQMDSV